MGLSQESHAEDTVKSCQLIDSCRTPDHLARQAWLEQLCIAPGKHMPILSMRRILQVYTLHTKSAAIA